MRPAFSTMFSLLLMLIGSAGPLHAGSSTGVAPDAVAPEAMATFAGGCFWCMEARFEDVPGVRAVLPGYTGGGRKQPNYEQVADGHTGHVEAIRVYFDPKTISFEGLLQVYWRMIDPTDGGGQFVDRGSQYRPVIFYHNPEQRIAAIRSKAALQRSRRYKKPLIVPIETAKTFWLAEDEHQDFYKRNDVRFRAFRYLNPRGTYLKRVWGRDLELDYSKYRSNTPG